LVRLPARAGERQPADLTVPPTSPAREALEISVTGVVQGVGFRPFVHRLALRHGLDGWVRNEAGEVRIVAEGHAPRLAAFVRALAAEAPPLARIERLTTSPVPPVHHVDFRIVESADQPDRRQAVSPDVSLCGACERELYDPTDRRHRYPFITCTDCGPRFTVIDAMPYDRERTSMRAFSQCAACLAEYRDPADRRYHSETNSCPECGPRVWVEGAGERGGGGSADRGIGGSADAGVPGPRGVRDLDAIHAAAEALRRGEVVAVRGLGGFHLAVDATDETAVVRLRRRKAREAKPLAVMVRTVEDARRLGDVGPQEALLLTSRERPVVLLRRHSGSGLAPSVAPGLDTVGVMTAYTPLHHLLLDLAQRPLVMTSGNVSDEPIATSPDDARHRLGEIADLFLMHDREIVARYDDSVVRMAAGGPIFLRRARGYAPLPVTLPVPVSRPLLAVGPHLKNTFTLAHGATAYVSQHIGDLENLETLEHFRASLRLFQELFRIEPEVVVRDLHPGYLSTRVAEDLGRQPVVTVQHHHAHVAAVAAEHGVTDPIIGVAYDGTGYGDDGAVWGAEIFVADLATYDRRCQLRYAPLPGGDLAVRQPWRVALGYLSLEPDAERSFAAAFEGEPAEEVALAQRQIERGLNSPVASSMGRLFDAVAAVIGIRRRSFYEGQAAMELEALAGARRGEPLPLAIVEDGDARFRIDPLPLLRALGERRAGGAPVEDLAASFHDAVADATADVVTRLAEATAINQVAIGGGVFQNARLTSTLVSLLEARRLTPLVPRQLSPNDGAISYGQAAAAAQLLQRTTIG
jgi:hydrogenase maturation protein HypF